MDGYNVSSIAFGKEVKPNVVADVTTATIQDWEN
jgi:hypothetical protein